MNYEKTIGTVIDGTEVEGSIIHRSSSDIRIRIEKPYENILGGCHIPWFARSFHSFDGDDGDAEAKRILEELFNIGKYLDENLGNLKEKLTCVKDKINGLAAKMLYGDKFDEEKRQLKISLKQGDIDDKEYQIKLRALKKEFKQFDLEAQACMNWFFEQFPMEVPFRTREEVLDTIEGKKSLNVD